MLATIASCSSKPEIAFTVNDLGVEKAELIYHMRDMSSIVSGELYTANGIERENGFWTGTYGDIVPLTVLRDRAIVKIARYKIEQLLAEEYAIITPMSWSEQQSDMEKQNRDRKAAKARGDIVYGRIELDYTAYFASFYYEMQLDLIEKLVADGVIGEDNAEDEYERLIDTKTAEAEINQDNAIISIDELGI
jgi:hypothetical protein